MGMVRELEGSKVLVFGGAGQLGSDLVDVFGFREKCHVIAPDHNMLDLILHKDVRNYICENRPKIVINCAAMHNLDACERDPLRAFEVNSLAQANLASVCSFFGITLVYISTNYVFCGDQSKYYNVFDTPNPVNIYGWSKYAGEIHTKHICPKHYIVRTGGLFGMTPPRGKKYNFVDLVVENQKAKLEMTVKNDETTSPTYTIDLCEKIAHMIKNCLYGTYHICNDSYTSWYKFAMLIANRLPYGNPRLIIPTTSATLQGMVKRPKCSVLSTSFFMPRLMDALDRYLSAKGEIDGKDESRDLPSVQEAANPP